jgi:hypothetical protein
MSTPKPSQITVEDAVARMVSQEYIPEGLTVQDMAAAFSEDASTNFDEGGNAQRTSNALRADVCDARSELVRALIAAMDYELGRGSDSMLVSSEDANGIKRVTTESLSQWCGGQFGITAPEWEPWNQYPDIEGARWEDVTIKILADYQLGYRLGNANRKKMSFLDLGLIGKRKLEPNKLGGILIGLSKGERFPPSKNLEAKDKTAICKLRGALVRMTGISEDPFLPFNVTDGWKPRFELIDDRRNADERAKARAHHVYLDDTKDYEREGDDADNWIENNS